MKRLERLQWIPMILKAWNEARERVEGQQTGLMETPPPVRGKPESAKPGAKPRAQRPVGRSRSKPGHRPKVRHLKRIPTPQGQRRVLRTRRMPAPPDYQAVLQELREARAQLSQLESIRHQLNEMQAWFEQRLPAATHTDAAASSAEVAAPSHRQPGSPGQPADAPLNASQQPPGLLDSARDGGRQ
ncbi:hypothetical protein JI721_10135 [Alicyclobacillus cycloheptanicus]|uniref:Transposase n=1 Tax=Alicyclobacillus cycloheptanicus TaxID=1457 RepID=A0ABT9XIF2_9BACL|nr:hypothetical protein [Alicyclobacillus cycloheptanicus]MDQ0189977.1 hypothetical protein [Alicyclobacillus cycloheptanicus]WDM00111.1 hypothetical protein JI721_10135 [Alicyclobacillus cycloheptanicus]